MESGERLRLQSIISVLVQQLGGEANLSEAEITAAKPIEVQVQPDGLSIRVEVKHV